jgi:hypothetical protein
MRNKGYCNSLKRRYSLIKKHVTQVRERDSSRGEREDDKT